jgi:hypothetical protein
VDPAFDRIEVQVGGAWVPDAVWGWLSARDQHPLLAGLAVDASWLHPLSPTGALAVRVGVIVPNIPDANWSASDASVDPMYTQVGLTVIDLTAGYAWRKSLTGPLAWTARGEVGVMYLAGSVDQTETLPSCPADEAETCAHWRVVGRGALALPSPVLPTLRATTGLEYRFADRATLSLEAGLRGTPWLGAGASVGF